MAPRRKSSAAGSAYGKSTPHVRDRGPSGTASIDLPDASSSPPVRALLEQLGLRRSLGHTKMDISLECMIPTSEPETEAAILRVAAWYMLSSGKSPTNIQDLLCRRIPNINIQMETLLSHGDDALKAAVSPDKLQTYLEWCQQFSSTWSVPAKDHIEMELSVLEQAMQSGLVNIDTERLIYRVADHVELLSFMVPNGIESAVWSKYAPILLTHQETKDYWTQLRALYHAFQDEIYGSQEHSRLWLFIWRAIKLIHIASRRPDFDLPDTTSETGFTVDSRFFKHPLLVEAFTDAVLEMGARPSRLASVIVAKYCSVIAQAHAETLLFAQYYRNVETSELNSREWTFLCDSLAEGQVTSILLHMTHRAALRLASLRGASTLEALYWDRPGSAPYTPEPETAASSDFDSDELENVRQRLPDLSGYSQICANDYVHFPFPETRAHEVTTNEQITQEMSKPGLVSDGARVQYVVNIPKRHVLPPTKSSLWAPFWFRGPFRLCSALLKAGLRWKFARRQPGTKPRAHLTPRSDDRRKQVTSLAPRRDSASRVSKYSAMSVPRLRGGGKKPSQVRPGTSSSPSRPSHSPISSGSSRNGSTGSRGTGAAPQQAANKGAMGAEHLFEECLFEIRLTDLEKFQRCLNFKAAIGDMKMGTQGAGWYVRNFLEPSNWDVEAAKEMYNAHVEGRCQERVMRNTIRTNAQSPTPNQRRSVTPTMAPGGQGTDGGAGVGPSKNRSPGRGCNIGSDSDDSDESDFTGSDDSEEDKCTESDEDEDAQHVGNAVPDADKDEDVGSTTKLSSRFEDPSLMRRRDRSTPIKQESITPTKQESITPTKQESITSTKQESSTPIRQQSAKPIKQQNSTPIQQQSTTPSDLDHANQMYEDEDDIYDDEEAGIDFNYSRNGDDEAELAWQLNRQLEEGLNAALSESSNADADQENGPTRRPSSGHPGFDIYEDGREDVDRGLYQTAAHGASNVLVESDPDDLDEWSESEPEDAGPNDAVPSIEPELPEMEQLPRWPSSEGSPPRHYRRYSPRRGNAQGFGGEDSEGAVTLQPQPNQMQYAASNGNNNGPPDSTEFPRPSPGSRRPLGVLWERDLTEEASPENMPEDLPEEVDEEIDYDTTCHPCPVYQGQVHHKCFCAVAVPEVVFHGVSPRPQQKKKKKTQTLSTSASPSGTPRRSREQSRQQSRQRQTPQSSPGQGSGGSRGTKPRRTPKAAKTASNARNKSRTRSSSGPPALVLRNPISAQEYQDTMFNNEMKDELRHRCIEMRGNEKNAVLARMLHEADVDGNLGFGNVYAYRVIREEPNARKRAKDFKMPPREK